MTDLKKDLRTEGACRLIKDGLQMEAGSTLLILYQDELYDLARFIADVAATFKIQVDQRRFSAQEFGGKYPAAFSPARLADATPIPQGIVLLIEWSVKTTAGRLELLRDLQATGQRWRIASMPGVTLDHLNLCAAPIDQIKQQCFFVFATLARAQSAILRTTTPTGGEDKLVIPISEFCPNISTGAIETKTWGNFPSGETFVVPNPYASHGWMTLRGSFPGHVLGGHDWLRFEVFRGRIRFKSIEASSRVLKFEFSRLFFRTRGDVLFRNANAIAELGVGTNSAVTRLTGNPIFDEKRIGTIHLGLGSNKQFKGPIESNSHHDITCLHATLETPSATIVREGQMVLTADQAIPPLRFAGRVTLAERASFQPTQRTMYEFNNTEGKLYLMYAPYRGGSVKVTVDGTGAIDVAQWILEEAKSHRSVNLKDLMAHLPHRFDPSDAKAVFSGLADLGLLEATSG